MAGGDGRHVQGTVAEHMGKCFVFFTVAAGRGTIRPAAFHGVGWDAVKVGSMDKPPVFESDVEVGEEPVEAIGILVSGEGMRDFALVS